MKKILLIEDRVERQEKFILDTGINLETHTDILDNQTILNKDNLFKYSIIIVHRSAFGELDENVLDFLKKYSEENKIKLVFFSGGISSTYYSNTKYEFLLLNSKSFYSKNLELFFNEFRETNEANLLLLGYGENWRINIILNTLSRINLFISNNELNEKVKFNNFKTLTKISTIENIIDFEYPEEFKGTVQLNELKSLSKQITKNLKRKIELYA